MSIHNSASKETNWVTLVMILLGILLIISGKLNFAPQLINELLDSFGIVILSVFTIELIYQKFIAEKHFKDFKIILENQYKELDLIQSKCLKFGIEEIFETRNIYEISYPFIEIIRHAPENSEIMCVARSMFSLLNKTGELKEGLKKGISFKFAIVDPNRVSPCLEKIALLYKSDIDSAQNALKDLLQWASDQKINGSLELRYHWADFPDTALIFTYDDEEKLAWDLGFGRDHSQKRVILLKTSDQSLGTDLKNRYRKIYENGTEMILYSDRTIKLNKFNWKFDL